MYKMSFIEMDKYLHPIFYKGCNYLLNQALR